MARGDARRATVQPGLILAKRAAPVLTSDEPVHHFWTVRDQGRLGSAATNGAMQTVAIIDAYTSRRSLPTSTSGRSTRLPTMTAGPFPQVVAPGIFRRPQDPKGWSGEETLDVEAVHGMAPAAIIVYVGAPNSYQDLDAQAAVEGIGIYFLITFGQ